jgi:hypothetical protein
MAVYTVIATGLWSASGTWSVSGGSFTAGGPGSGDTVTFNASNTVMIDLAAGALLDGQVILGTDTGAALTLSGATDVTLAAGTGCSLRLKGDLVLGPTNATNFHQLVFAPGSSLFFYPADGVQLKYNIANGGRSRLIFNGNSFAAGHFCQFGTDQSRQTTKKPAYFDVGGSSPYSICGVTVASFTKFSLLGDSNGLFGVGWIGGGNGGAMAGDTISWTDNQIDRCNVRFGRRGGDNSWDGPYTFQRNEMTNSVPWTSGGTGWDRCAIAFESSNTFGGSNVRLIDSNKFDCGVGFGAIREPTFTNNVIAVSDRNVMVFSDPGNCTWSNASQFQNNLLALVSGLTHLYEIVSGWPSVPAGPNYCLDNGTDTPPNPHYFDVSSTANGNILLDGWVFEAGQGGGGDILANYNASSVTTGTPVYKVVRCLVLAISGGADVGISSGTLCEVISNATNSTIKWICEHNTFIAHGGDPETAPLGVAGEAMGQYVDLIKSVRGNLTVNFVNNLQCYAATDFGIGQGNGSQVVANALTVAGWNGFLNPTTGVCVFNGTNHNTVGYGGFKFSAAYPGNLNPSTDVTVSADPFFDSTRNIRRYGQRVLGVAAGADDYLTNTVNAILANPSLVGAALTDPTPGLIAWVKYGYHVIDSSLRGASYGTDPLTVDSAGNAWGGGATADIGAMSWINPAPTKATLTGPTSGLVGVASSNFTITLDAPAQVSESFPITYPGGSIASSPVVIGIGSSTGTFTVTPSALGAANVTLGAGSSGLTIAGSPISYTGTSAPPTLATLSGPTSGVVGIGADFTITLDHPAGVGGVSCPVSSSVGGDTVTSSPLVIPAGSSSGIVTITASSAGARSITLGATTPGLSLAGSPITFTARASLNVTGTTPVVQMLDPGPSRSRRRR